MSRSALLAWVLAASACAPSAQSVATRYVKTQAIVAAQGGTLTVAPTDSQELAGLSVVVPAGALPNDLTVTVELGLDDLARAPNTASSAVALLGPEATLLLKPIQVVLPYTPEADELNADVAVERLSGGARALLVEPKVVRDAAARTVSLTIEGFGALQVVQQRCEVPPAAATDGSVSCSPLCNQPCVPGSSCQPDSAGCMACRPTSTTCGATATCTPQGRCRGPVCGITRCAVGQTCCDPNCGICGANDVCPSLGCGCSASDCGTPLGSPTCICRDGTVGCNTGRCVRAGPTSSCAWEVRTCP